ncbi:MAG: ribonuclease, partial [Solirubrobacteraceae bacterium]
AQLGYEALLHEMVGVRLRKSASFTRWDTRPLSEEQVGYAREDVLHLNALADALQSALSASGRLDWALEECRILEEASDEREPVTIFNRLPRVNSLEPAQRAVALELVRWREETARENDRPVPSVLADAPLVEVAKRRPASLDRLAQIRGLNESTLRRRGRAILSVVERGRTREPIPVDGDRPAPTDANDAPLIALGEALVRARAAEAGLAYELIAARADLQRVVTAVRLGEPEAEVRTLQGWRREVVGTELLELLQGRRSLRVGPSRTISVED